MSARILIVDDDPGYRFSLRDYLAHLGYRIAEAGSCAEARQTFKNRELDLILLDLQLPDGDGLVLLDEIAQMGDAVEVIMISGHGTIEKAVRAMQKGACDFVPKPGEMSDLVARIKKALELRGLKRRSAGRADTFAPPIVGKSKQMISCLEACRRLAQTDTTVLFLGETGTGKEILARYLHAVSPRRDGPFVAVSCANFTEQLIDDDLFGHESGAFTGAHKVKQGKVESADGGTLFLDEIGEMPYSLQAKLLRFLETCTYTRVGGVKEREIDVRIVAATNRDLQAETKEGRFRPDLFFRLNVFSLYIPPLREWREGIPDLIGHFLSQMAYKQSRNGFTIAPDALERLMEYHWPGNVRELRNVIERATVISTDGTIRESDLPLLADGPKEAPQGRYHEQLLEYQKQVLLSALRECHGNRTEAAKRLGLHRTDFQRRIRELGLQTHLLQDKSTDL